MSSGLTTTTILPDYFFLQNLNVGLDIIVIVTWVAATFVYALTIGRKKGPILLLSTYAGLSVAAIVSQLSLVGSESLTEIQNGPFFAFIVFAILFIVAFVSLVRIISRQIKIHSGKHGLFLLSALEMAAFLASVGSLLPSAMQKQITGFAGLLFVTPWTQTLWLVLPLFIILIGEHKDSSILERD